MGSEYAHVIAYMVFTQSIYMNIRPRLLHVFWALYIVSSRNIEWFRIEYHQFSENSSVTEKEIHLRLFEFFPICRATILKKSYE